jgi:hypothetical protein
MLHLLRLRADTLFCGRRCPLRVIGFVISWIGASTSSDSVTNRSISHRPAGPGGVSLVYGLHGIFYATPVRKVQAHEPSGFDIGANDRFRHSAPSESCEKKLVPRCLIADAPGIEADDPKIPALQRAKLRLWF